MSVKKYAAIGAGVGLLLGVACAVLFGAMMLDTNNQGEFADYVTGEWTSHFYIVMGLTIALVAVPIAAFFAIMGFVRRTEQ